MGKLEPYPTAAASSSARGNSGASGFCPGSGAIIRRELTGARTGSDAAGLNGVLIGAQKQWTATKDHIASDVGEQRAFGALCLF
jgi:hypothetical protein